VIVGADGAAFTVTVLLQALFASLDSAMLPLLMPPLALV
jgi:hypothetical protein